MVAARSAASSWGGCALESVREPSNQWHALLASKLSGDHLPVQPFLQQLGHQVPAARTPDTRDAAVVSMQVRLAVPTEAEAADLILAS